MIRAYKFLMRPTVGQAQSLGEMLRDHCSLYNGALQERRDAYRHVSKTSVTYGQQSAQLKDMTPSPSLGNSTVSNQLTRRNRG